MFLLFFLTIWLLYSSENIKLQRLNLEMLTRIPNILMLFSRVIAHNPSSLCNVQGEPVAQKMISVWYFVTLQLFFLYFNLFASLSFQPPLPRKILFILYSYFRKNFCFLQTIINIYDNKEYSESEYRTTCKISYFVEEGLPHSYLQ